MKIESLNKTFCDHHQDVPEKQYMQQENWKMILGYTPPKFNMEPENDGFQKESPFPGVDFQVPC